MQPRRLLTHVLLLLFVLLALLLSACGSMPAAAMPAPAETPTPAPTPTPNPTATFEAMQHTMATWVALTLTAQPMDTPTPAATPTHTPTPNPVAFTEIVLIPAGPFQMGCSPDDDQCDDEEKPLHEVTLDAYLIDTWEVTNARYAACVDAGGCTPPQDVSSYTHDPYYGNPDFADFPVINVDWNQANTFCAWEGERLPTEAEWEKAARGSDDTRIYPWGNSAPTCDLLNFYEAYDLYLNGEHDLAKSCVGDTTKVGSYPSGASPYGVMDLSGNVLEWVNDWREYGYYSASPANNPQGPDSGEDRVLRGGSWSDRFWGVRASLRGGLGPDYSGDYIGFRCARSQ